MALLTFYGDESGTEDKSNVAVAGYVSDKSRWDLLGQKWQQILSDENVEVLHRTDMEPPFYGEFRGWTRGRQISVLRRAHSIIKKARIYGCGVAVKSKAFRELAPPQTKRTFGGAYGFCARCCVIAVGRWARERNHWVTYIFESGAKGRHEVDKTIGDMVADKELQERFRIADWGFASKKGPCAVIQLQAADFMAFEAYKQIDNRFVLGERRPYRKSAKDLIDPVKDRLCYISDGQLLDWVLRALKEPELVPLILGRQ